MAKKTEIYTYNRKELDDNRVMISKNEKNNILYLTETTLGTLFNPNSNIPAGQITYINELVSNPINSFNTAVGTIVTKNGSLIFNFGYVLKFEDSRPPDNLLLTSKPTFMSGEYLSYPNIKINVQILQSNGERILSIEYD
jgi:hypothetical protein